VIGDDVRHHMRPTRLRAAIPVVAEQIENALGAIFVKFFGSDFRIFSGKIPGTRKNFRDIHILLAVARPYVPDPVCGKSPGYHARILIN
jgi:hypothetical protein